MRSASLLAAAALWGAAPAAAQSAARYSPSFGSFTCELPGPAWQAYEDEEPAGPVVRLLGPDDPEGVYRAGMDIRLVEKGQPGYLPWREALERYRRGAPGRSSSAVKNLRVPGTMARIVEVVEKRWLPEERLPAREVALHHYVAAIPAGESYFLIKLSSTRETYLDYRSDFFRFLKSFRGR